MNSFEFFNPVRVLFEPHAIHQVGKHIKSIGSSILLVTYLDTKPFESILSIINSQCESLGVKCTVFNCITPNPTIQQVEKGVELVRSTSIDCIVALGGGSVMDATKAIAAGALYDGELWNMVATSHRSNSTVRFPNKALPTIMIPTMAATGSEMNCCAVIGNELTSEKSYIWNECLYTKLAIVDSSLTYSLPAYQTACGAADIISHALEFYLNGLENTPLNYYIQEGIIKTVMEQIHCVIKNPSDEQARTDLQWASIMALNGISQPGNAWTPIHQIGHVISAKYGVAHGVSLSLLMPAWMRAMKNTRHDQYLRFARVVMQNTTTDENEAVVEAIDSFESFLRSIKIPTRFDDLGITSLDLEEIANEVQRISFNDDNVLPSHTNVTKETIIELLEQVVKPYNKTIHIL